MTNILDAALLSALIKYATKSTMHLPVNYMDNNIYIGDGSVTSLFCETIVKQ